MRDFANSMLRFSWAASVYGAQSMVAWFAPAVGVQTRTGARIPPSPAWASRGQLGEPERLVFQAADELQSSSRGWVQSWLDPRSWTPEALLRSGADLWQGSQQIAAAAFPGSQGNALRLEWRNRLRVYRWVRKARALAGSSGLESPNSRGASFDLLAALQAEKRNPRKGSLWIAEGLAHDWVESMAAEGQSSTAALLRPVLQAVPDRFLLPVHAGAGLALAEKALRVLTPRSPASDFRLTLDRLEILADEGAAPGFRAALLESLGLVTRCFYPPLVAPLDRQLLGRSGDLRRLFWHGAGRALYFLPQQLLPGVGSAEGALRGTLREPPDDASRRHALGGMAWAFAAVNCHTPQVLERLLLAQGRSLENTSFEAAFTEAIVFLHRCAPEVSPGPRLFAHQPETAVASALWQRWILQPLAPLLIQEAGCRPTVDAYAASLTEGGPV